MKKTNYHTHTKRCMHAEGTEADYVKAALDAGLDVLGFSDHGPFPDNRFDSRMPYADLDEYLACMDALRPTVPFPILKGLEIEYCPDSRDYYSFLLKEKKLDYLLLGQHYYQEDDGSYVHVFSIPEKIGTRGYIKYAHSVKEALETGCFPILAHPDVFFNNPYSWDDNCEEACDIILRKIESQKSYRKGDEPTSIYHIEYEPRLIVRGSTGYAPDESHREKKKK